MLVESWLRFEKAYGDVKKIKVRSHTVEHNTHTLSLYSANTSGNNQHETGVGVKQTKTTKIPRNFATTYSTNNQQSAHNTHIEQQHRHNTHSAHKRTHLQHAKTNKHETQNTCRGNNTRQDTTSQRLLKCTHHQTYIVHANTFLT